MASEIDNVIETLDLEQLEHNLFRGLSPRIGWQRVFGGQVIGQALVAAIRTIPDGKNCHSLHGYFIRPGDPASPIIYEVERYRDGTSFATRGVSAIQHGKTIFVMNASFHHHEDGLEHQMTMPDVPAPEDLPSEKQIIERFRQVMPENMRRYFARERPIELRPVRPSHYLNPKKQEDPVQNVWIRASRSLPDGLPLHQCILAYASDMTLLDTSLVVHGRNFFDPHLMLASLDHSIWFHRPFRADEWLLYAQDSPAAFGARGLNRGCIFTRDGQLVASVAQEGLIRKKR